MWTGATTSSPPKSTRRASLHRNGFIAKSDSEHVDRQRTFYDTREHQHLQAREDDRYAHKLAAELARDVGMGPEHRVLEIGAGFGRFTFHLLDYCGSVLALDLSPVALEKLEFERDRLGIEQQMSDGLSRSRRGGPDGPGERFDFIVGFFLLHHLPNFAGSIRNLAPLLSPGGRIAFLEPNRLASPKNRYQPLG